MAEHRPPMLRCVIPSGPCDTCKARPHRHGQAVADGHRPGAARWLADLVCCSAPCEPSGSPCRAFAVATAYGTVQLVRQDRLPRRCGRRRSESLFVGLTAPGAGPTAAAAVVIVYRVLSCWAILPVGLACLLAQRPARRT